MDVSRPRRYRVRRAAWRPSLGQHARRSRRVAWRSVRAVAYTPVVTVHSDLESTTIARGASAEDRAVAWLARAGYRIVERNYRCKLGELDIIARDGATLVFVEVRSRQTARFGSALEAVGWAKQRRVSRMAQHYVARRRPRFAEARFDVVAITGDDIVLVRDAWRL
jgi:putative endonuclease